MPSPLEEQVEKLARLLEKAVGYIESEFAYPGWETKFGEPNPTAQFVAECYTAIEAAALLPLEVTDEMVEAGAKGIYEVHTIEPTWEKATGWHKDTIRALSRGCLSAALTQKRQNDQANRKVPTMKPTIGRIVTYRSRTGDYDIPAIITATQDTLHQPNVDAGLIPGCASPDHVHLTCFTPGAPGKRAEATDFKTESPHGRAENVGGIYQEWDIPLSNHDEGLTPIPGSWRWPERV